MSKRRNPKKEKAERNKIYTRKFQKKQSRYSNQNKSFGRINFKQDKDDLNEDTKKEQDQ